MWKRALVIVPVFLFFCSFVHFTLETFSGNYSGFLRLRERRVERVPFITEELKQKLLLREQSGYDGQWYYYIAFDPFLSRFADDPIQYDHIIDAPPYRYGRIVYPLLTNVFSLSNPENFPRTMIWLIVGFHIVGLYFFIRLLEHYGRSPFWGFLYAIIPSSTMCLNLGVPEAIASAVLVTGLYFYVKERFVISTLIFSLAILIRETTVLFIVILILFELFNKRFRVALILSACFVPYGFWRLFLTWRLFDVYGWQTIFYSPGDFTVPFGGVFDLYFRHWETTSRNRALVLFPFFILTNFVFGVLLAVFRRDRLAFAVLGYSVLALCLNYHKIWGHIRDLERTMSDGTIFLMLSFAAIPTGSKPVLRYTILASFGLLLLYKVFISPVAPLFRAALNLFACF